MNERQAPELEEDYYLDNFHTIAAYVVGHYDDLLTQSEQQWFHMIHSASKPAQRLYIRLLNRRGSTFRLSKLGYVEIESIDATAEELTERGLANSRAPHDWPVLLGCFTKPELLELLELHDLRTLCRVDLVGYIMACAPALQEQFRQVLQASDQWVTIEGHHHWMLMQLCFFGNLYQDSSELVLRQLGSLTYENYPLDPSARAFTSREQINAHWRYFEAEALFDNIDQRDAAELLSLANSLPEPCANDPHLRRRLDRIRNRIARQLERLSCADEAMKLYELSTHPPARERRVRIMMASLQWQAALSLAQEMSETSYNERERLTALKLVQQCQKPLGVKTAKRHTFKPVTTRLVLRHDGARVEELARRFYANRGACFHTENTLVNGVLGLFIWDIIFHPVPGVFFNPFQVAPADFNEPEFLINRADLLEARFAELDDQVRLGARVLTAYERHRGKQNPLVRWHGLSADMLALAIDRIPLNHWRALFERILADTRENTTGFPDLVMFPFKGGYEFIEIKGPGDALQANQRRWMHYFDQQGIACRLVHVRFRSSDSVLT